ncbi:MAG: U32 family peptidase [Saccharofermentanales bacterium]
MNIKDNENEHIELLSPAGDFDSLKAAIGNGADSIYFGSKYFSARNKAVNISDDEMEEAVDYAHVHSCKAYLALNTLLLDDEIPLALDIARTAYKYGIDAIIVQDLGFASLLKKELPDLPLHASTQATIFDEYAIDACAETGFCRIILPRELSVQEIKRLTAYAKKKDIETEVFVHGALCVCYSGQCVMSSLIGGRSGNRGECAQPCRLPYDVTVGKRPKNMSAPHLATKDLCAIGHVEELIKAGVKALKIEGRMRSTEYVSVVTQEFFKQINHVYNKMKFDKLEPSRQDSEKGDIENLLLAFNRGGSFTDHYLAGKKSPDMMAGEHTGSFGVLLGEIAARNSRIGIIDIRKTPQVTASQSPDKGDVISIRRTGKDDEIASAPIGSAEVSGSNIRIKGFHPDVIETLQTGDLVYRMSDTRNAKKALSNDLSKTLLDGRLYGEDDKIILEWTVSGGIADGVSHSEIFDLEIQDEKIISEQRVFEQLSKTGGTPFKVRNVVVDSKPAMPVSSLNSLRRESLEGMAAELKQHFKRTLPVKNYSPVDFSAIKEIINEIDFLAPDKFMHETTTQDKALTKTGSAQNTVSAYFYSWDGSASSIACKADWYELPAMAFMDDKSFQGISDLRKLEPDARFAVVLPPVYIGAFREIAPGLIRKLADAGFGAIVSGNPGNSMLCIETGLECFQDTGSNVMNTFTAGLLKSFGATAIAPSVELSAESLLEIAGKSFAGENCIYELPVYGKLRLMYSEHCPIGYNRSGCKACDSTAAFALKDRKGMSFPVICHKGACTVDILNCDNLCVPAEIVKIAEICDLRARLYFTDEILTERTDLVSGFRKLISDPGASDINSEIEKIRRVAVNIASSRNCGLTKGHYQRGM